MTIHASWRRAAAVLAAAAAMLAAGCAPQPSVQVTQPASRDGTVESIQTQQVQKVPSALGAVNSQVERTDTSSGPLYRLQAGPFPNREAAANACASIRAAGGQCFIVGPLAP